MSVCLKSGSAEPQCSARGCQELRETKDGRVLLEVLTLYVRIKIHLATFDTVRSVADSKQSMAAAMGQLPDSALRSVSTVRHWQ